MSLEANFKTEFVGLLDKEFLPFPTQCVRATCRLAGGHHSERWSYELGLSPKCLSVGDINEFREFPEIKLIANFPNLIADLRICALCELLAPAKLHHPGDMTVIRVRAFPKCLAVGGINEIREFPEISEFPELNC